MIVIEEITGSSIKIEIMTGIDLWIDKNNRKDKKNSNKKSNKDNSEEKKVPSPKFNKLIPDKINWEL